MTDKSRVQRLKDLERMRFRITAWLKGSGDTARFTRQEIIDNCPLGEWVCWDDGVVVRRYVIKGCDVLLTKITQGKSTVKWFQDTPLIQVITEGDCESPLHGLMEHGKPYVMNPGEVNQWATKFGCSITAYL